MQSHKLSVSMQILTQVMRTVTFYAKKAAFQVSYLSFTKMKSF